MGFYVNVRDELFVVFLLGSWPDMTHESQHAAQPARRIKAGVEDQSITGQKNNLVGGRHTVLLA
jgi:hypothetical protein